MLRGLAGGGLIGVDGAMAGGDRWFAADARARRRPPSSSTGNPQSERGWMGRLQSRELLM